MILRSNLDAPTRVLRNATHDANARESLSRLNLAQARLNTEALRFAAVCQLCHSSNDIDNRRREHRVMTLFITALMALRYFLFSTVVRRHLEYPIAVL